MTMSGIYRAHTPIFVDPNTEHFLIYVPAAEKVQTVYKIGWFEFDA